MVNLRRQHPRRVRLDDVRSQEAPAPLVARPGTATGVEDHRAFAWTRSTTVLSLLSGLLLWASFPPLGWWPLAWIAPVGWLMLVRYEPLPGRRPYRTIALTGFLHWLVLLQGIRLAHPALYLGWISLAAYMAVYPLLFVAARAHRRASLADFRHLRCPRRLDGFGTGARPRDHGVFDGLAWAHSSIVDWAAADRGRVWRVRRQLPRDAGGGVCSSCAARRDRRAGADRSRWALWPLLPASLALAGAIAYGEYQLRVAGPSPTPREPLRVALIQGSFDTIFEFNADRDRDIFLRYRQLSEQAVAQHPGRPTGRLAGIHVQLATWVKSSSTARSTFRRTCR